MEKSNFAPVEDDIVYLDGEGELVSLHNLIAELSFGQDVDMECTENRNKLWGCIDRLQPQDRSLVNMIYFYDENRRPDNEIAKRLGVSDPAVLSRRRRSVLNTLRTAMLR